MTSTSRRFRGSVYPRFACPTVRWECTITDRQRRIRQESHWQLLGTSTLPAASAEMMGKDARARGVHFVLAPGMNIYRAPMNGRNFEYLGEDPYLASRMAVSLIEGIQSRGVIATAKHFAVNNQEYGRMDHSSDVDERTLREIYLPAFEAAVKEAKVGALMDAYNLVNGAYMTENNFLNNVIARKEWGFDGIIMSDWGATHDGKAAANGGLDLEMPSALFMNKQTLLPFIQSGEIPNRHNRRQGPPHFAQSHSVRVLRSRANRRNHPFVQPGGKTACSRRSQQRNRSAKE